MAFVSAAGQPSRAEGTPEANAGLAACASRSGKALHNCVADVLEKYAALNSAIPQTQAEMLRAASGLRAAANKAQALLAITQCQNVIVAALKQATESGARVRGMGSIRSLGLIAGVIAKAVRLIQTRG